MEPPKTMTLKKSEFMRKALTIFHERTPKVEFKVKAPFIQLLQIVNNGEILVICQISADGLVLPEEMEHADFSYRKIADSKENRGSD